MSDESADTPKRKSSKKTVTVRNRSMRAVTSFDAAGEGVHIPPKGTVELAVELVGTDLNRKAKQGLLSIA